MTRSRIKGQRQDADKNKEQLRPRRSNKNKKQNRGVGSRSNYKEQQQEVATWSSKIEK